MKKGVFTVANYFGPKRGVLSMHCSSPSARTSRRKSSSRATPGADKAAYDATAKKLAGLFVTNFETYAAGASAEVKAAAPKT
jgi:ATP-dependent phosphoenolpyruvate carboxykinase